MSRFIYTKKMLDIDLTQPFASGVLMYILRYIIRSSFTMFSFSRRVISLPVLQTAILTEQ